MTIFFRLNQLRDSGIETPALAEMRQDLIQLDEAALALIDGDILRKAEVQNVRQLIFSAVQIIIDGDFAEADEYLDAARQRINFLAANPESAGEHEKHRKTLLPHDSSYPAGFEDTDPGFEVLEAPPKSSKRKIT